MNNTLDYEAIALCAKQCVKEVPMDKGIEQELFLVYENLLEANLKGNKTDSVMARFFISIKEQLKNFEEAYPEIVSEYHFINK